MDKKYLPSVVILYLNYFIHGIGCSLLSQQVVKEMLAAQWGVGDVMTVTAVAAALGLGRLVSLPFAGPLSDKLGRRISVLIGAASYVIFFIGIAFSPNIQVAYVAAVLGGIAIGILGVLAIFAPMPAGNAAAKSESFISSLKNANFSVESIALIMIASSLCNYTILSAAAKMSSMQVIMMNIVITVIGVLLAVFVNVRYASLLAKIEQ